MNIVVKKKENGFELDKNGLKKLYKDGQDVCEILTKEGYPTKIEELPIREDRPLIMFSI